MTKQLRKRHLQFWSVLVFILPAIIVAGILAVKKPIVTSTLLQPASTTALPVIINSVEKEKYIVRLRTDKSGSQSQLEWINTASVTNPSALIYYSPTDHNNGTDNNELIGRIESKGIYHFALKSDSTRNNRFILYDIIHRQIIDSINF